jgi:hypothetical protein
MALVWKPLHQTPVIPCVMRLVESIAVIDKVVGAAFAQNSPVAAQNCRFAAEVKVGLVSHQQDLDEVLLLWAFNIPEYHQTDDLKFASNPEF